MFIRMPGAFASACLLPIGLVLPAAGQTPQLRPGLWEITMAGVPQKTTQCLSAEKLKDTRNFAQKSATVNDCNVSGESVSGNTRTFNVSCTKPNKYNSQVSVTVNGPDNFTMTQNYTVTYAGDSQQGTITMLYRRMGECSRLAWQSHVAFPNGRPRRVDFLGPSDHPTA